MNKAERKSRKESDGVIFKDRTVFLDIETTGLNPDTEGITEIGAIAVIDDRIIDRFHTMINPGKPIPLGVRRLCGITDADVAGAPPARDIADSLAAFIGSDPVIAHNAAFESSFFAAHGLPQPSLWIDSLALAALLRPHLSRHNLESLVREFGIRDAEQHRALADAADTFHVLRALCRSHDFGRDHLDRIDRILAPDHGIAWRLVFDGMSTNAPAKTRHPPAADPPLPAPDRAWQPVTSKQVDEDLGAGGRMESVTGFRHRPQQLRMAHAVADTLNTRRFQIIESGTGTGKSLAYLVPTARAAMANNVHIAVSTHTRTLQHQLAERELPRINEILGGGLRWVVLKGRENYICPFQLDRRIREMHIDDTPGDRLLLAVLQGAVYHPDASGDLDRIGYWVQRQAVHAHAIISDIRNTGHHCHDRCRFKPVCPYQKILRRALSAHVFVVNHALSLRWPAAYPSVSHFIFDEAHNLEDAATSVFGDNMTESALHRLHRRLYDTQTGIAGQLLKNDPARIVSLRQHHENMLDRMKQCLENIFIGNRHRHSEKAGVQRLESTFNAAFRTPESPRKLDTEVLPICRELADHHRTVAAIIESTLKVDKKISESRRAAAKNLLDDLKTTAGFLERTADEPKTAYLYSVTLTVTKHRLTFEFQERPVSVAGLLNNNLWSRIDAAVLTSATLTVNGKPHFFQSRLGLYFIADRSRLKPAEIFDSPFDFKRRMLAVHPDGLPKLKHNEPEWALSTHRKIITDTARHFRGRTLVLMGSRARMQILGEWLETDLEAHGIEMLIQRSGGSRDHLLERFRSASGSVLMGVRSFWEGVDVPGPALTVVTIEKVPFPPLEEPLVKARTRHVESSRRNFGFSGYSLPIALIQLRQGIGRLIRSETDEGVVILLSQPLHPSYRRSVYGTFPVPPVSGLRWTGVMDHIRKQFPQKEYD